VLRDYVGARRSFNKILENRAKALLPSPSIYGDVENVYRPENRDADQREIQKIIRDIQRKRAQDEAARAASDGSEADRESSVVIDSEIASRLNAAYDLHKDEDDEANLGPLVAVIIGGVILVILLVYCVCKACMMRKAMATMKTAGG